MSQTASPKICILVRYFENMTLLVFHHDNNEPNMHKFFLTSPLWIGKFLWRALAVTGVSSCSEEIRSRRFTPYYQREEIGGHLQGVLHWPQFDKQRKTNSLKITKLAPWHSRRGREICHTKKPHANPSKAAWIFTSSNSFNYNAWNILLIWHEIIKNVERFIMSRLFHNLLLPVCNSWPASETRVYPSNKIITGSTHQPITEIITGIRIPDCSPEDPRRFLSKWIITVA